MSVHVLSTNYQGFVIGSIADRITMPKPKLGPKRKHLQTRNAEPKSKSELQVIAQKYGPKVVLPKRMFVKKVERARAIRIIRTMQKCSLSYDPYGPARVLSIKPSENVTSDGGRVAFQGSSGFLLYTRPSRGYKYKAEIKDHSLTSQPTLIINTAYTPEAITYDPVGQRIYWSDTSYRDISNAFNNGSNVKIVVKNVIKAVDLAIDDAARNLYWADSRRGRIEVARLDGMYRKVLVRTSYPTALVLDMKAREMYWSSFHYQMKIERASMDGSNRQVIVTDHYHNKPTGLSIDTEKRLLYWAEKNSHEIHYINYQPCQPESNVPYQDKLLSAVYTGKSRRKTLLDRPWELLPAQ
ncbi:hypothetical protein QZH41_006318 [Actinostola sp. cb2023]|nr:hypothetical protein QZH41_006318 [Actinostola sp. cb2023]